MIAVHIFVKNAQNIATSAIIYCILAAMAVKKESNAMPAKNSGAKAIFIITGSMQQGRK